MQDLQDKVLFITGGASGIGFGITKVLVDAGMQAVIADVRQDHIDEALAHFRSRQLAERVHAIRLDVADRKAMARAADESEHRFGKVHVLFNNAGIDPSGPFKQATYADWDYAVAVNLGGVINGVQTFLPRILRHGEGGHIFSTASLAGLIVMPAQMVMYYATKAGVIAFMESIRGELAADDIGVSVLCPGPIRSRIHESGKNRPERYRAGSGFREAEEQLARRVVSNLWMEPEQVGRMCLHAMLNNELYVITHGEWREAFQQRVDAILAAMPTEVNPELIASLRQPPPPAKS
jgi:NAD(P)-dependent dehydrogenase (short-subunit alcohol dehydrogenase family)